MCLLLFRAIAIDDTECTPKGDVAIFHFGNWDYHKNTLMGYTSKLNRQPVLS